ncbi:MAG: hypothetical protein V4515_10180 [Chloroflexota bacterium]
MPDFTTGRPGITRTATAIALLLVVAACSGGAGSPAATPSPTGEPIASVPTTAAPGATPGASPAATDVPTTPGALLTQAWATAELTDVRNGNTFRIADLVASNRVVFIETMAIWCANCRTQQRDVVKALAGLDPDRIVWIGVDVEASESATDLAEYSASLGFDWPFIVGSKDFLRALDDSFGSQVLSPPATPIVVVGTDGTVTLTEFGHKSVDRIKELAVAHGA